jgi:hypothetical protein
MDTLLSSQCGDVVSLKHVDDCVLMSDNSDVTTPTRKDIARTFTRILILEDLPMARFSRSFTKLEEVRLCSGCFKEKEEEEGNSSDDPDLENSDSYDPGRAPSLLRNCLLAIAPTSISTAPVHVKFQIEAKYNLQELECLLRQLNPPIPFIYEFYIQKITNSNRTALRLAYEHGGIVHYRLNKLFHGSLAWYIANQFDYLFYHEPAGQVYLCDVPTMVLTPEDYQAAGDNANEAAKRKIFNSISCFDSSIRDPSDGANTAESDASCDDITPTPERLPFEIMEMIIDYLKDSQSLETLATCSRVSHSIYELVIPKLYEEVEIKAYNQAALAYGHSTPSETSEFGVHKLMMDEANVRR